MSTEPRTVAVNVHVIKSLEIDESDCLAVMRHSVKMRTVDLLARLENLDEDYGDWDAERLAKELDDAGVKRTTRQVDIGGKNLAGYRREDLEAAVPAELLSAR